MRGFCRLICITQSFSSAIACTSDGEGDGDGGTTTSTTVATFSAATSSTTGPTCMDQLPYNGDFATAYDLAPQDEVEGPDFRHSLSAQLCPNESDFFMYSLPCAGYLGVEVIVDEDGDNVTLYLRDGMGTPLKTSDGSSATNYGAFRMEAIHHIVEVSGEALFIEVEHGGGDQIPYTLTTYFLSSGSCMAASWGCEATENLEAIETSCTAEPSSGACPTLAQTTTPVDLPTVGTGMAAFSGWLVHQSAAAVKYHARPSEGEYGDILELCREACRAQWRGNPDVEANCNDVDIFETPFLHEKPSFGSLAAIPSTYQDGSGIFPMESLSCNLHDTCCAAFDEAMCDVVVPLRLTPASLPLGWREEYVFELEPSSSMVIAVALGEDDTSELQGELGYSLCRDGNEEAPCPFYLGHLEFGASDPLEVEVTCPDESLQTLTLENLVVRLAQPAFGISKAGRVAKGFPPGALVYEGEYDLGNTHYRMRGPNADVVTLEADETSLDTSYVTVVGTAPCGQGTTTTTGLFQVVAELQAGPIASPPAIAIDIPSAVSCPSSVALSATTSDPDMDLANIRWIIDDVLMAASTTSVTFTTGHQVRAVATDARGAATTAVATVDCM